MLSFITENIKKRKIGITVIVWTYLAYLVISVTLTIWVAYTLYKNGRIFLVEAFNGNVELTDSVNHLLVLGFYLINIGFVSLFLKEGTEVVNLQTGLETLSYKIGIVLVVLGVMHFFNLFVFSRIRKNTILKKVPLPFPATAHNYNGG